MEGLHHTVHRHIGPEPKRELGLIKKEGEKEQEKEGEKEKGEGEQKKEGEKDGKHEESAMHDVLGGVGRFVEGQNEGKEIGQVFGIKKNAETDFQAFLSALVFGTFMLFFTIAIFIWLRRCSPSIYAHRVLAGDTGGEQTLPPSHDGCFGWAVAAWKVTDQEVMETAGLDALMFLEFCRLWMKLAFFLSPMVIGVLCPMHFYTPKGDCGRFTVDEACPSARCAWIKPNLKAVPVQEGICEAKYAKDVLNMLGINGLMLSEPTSTTPFWIHAAMVWLVVCLTLYLTRNTHLDFLKHRFNWLSAVPEPRSTTLMVECIPREYRSDEKLKQYFGHLFTDGAVERAYIVRKTDTLCMLDAQLVAKDAELKDAEKQWDRDGRNPEKCPKVQSFMGVVSGDAPNAIETYSEQLGELKAEVVKERLRIEEAVAHSDPSVVSSSGFVTFTSRRWCRHASREQYREDKGQWVVGMPPDPTDVVYTDLAKSVDVQDRGTLVAILLLILMFVVWTPLVAATSSLTSLPRLSKYIPGLKPFLVQFPKIEIFMQGVLATFALNFLMGWLPVFLMGIIRSFLTLKSGAWAQLKLYNRYFLFQVTFVLFVTTLGVSAVSTIEDIIDQPKMILGLLAASLPEASHFYLNYVLLGWFTASVELLRAPQMCYYLWNTRVAGMSPEAAREAAEPEDQDCYGMGARFGKVSLIMTLTLVFASCMPLITLVGTVFFFLCNIIYGYLLVFAETKKPDLGGAFWIVAVKHILFALVLYVALMGGILSSKRSGRYPALALIPVLLVLFLAWRRLRQYTWEVLPFESLADMDHAFNKRRTLTGCTIQAEGHYIQPECLDPDDLE